MVGAAAVAVATLAVSAAMVVVGVVAMVVEMVPAMVVVMGDCSGPSHSRSGLDEENHQENSHDTLIYES